MVMSVLLGLGMGKGMTPGLYGVERYFSGIFFTSMDPWTYYFVGLWDFSLVLSGMIEDIEVFTAWRSHNGRQHLVISVIK